MTFEEKKERLDDIKRQMTVGMVGYISVSFLIEELEKTWAALEDVSFARNEGGAEEYFGQKAWKALNE